MSRAYAIALAVGGVVAAAFGAYAVAGAMRKKQGSGGPASLGGGAPPPPPPAPKLVQGADGVLYEGTVGGKQVVVGEDGATINGTHFSLSELGLTAVTGGTYASTKYYLAHPGELASDLKNIPDKIGQAAETVGGWLGF